MTTVQNENNLQRFLAILKRTHALYIALNKNTIPGDKSALSPGGVRIGAPAMTTRGLKEADFEAVADTCHNMFYIFIFKETILSCWRTGFAERIKGRGL